MAQPLTRERRSWLRFDKVFPVRVESQMFGFSNCVARNISQGGIFLESRDVLPLGSPVRIYFSLPNDASGFSARGEVKNHYFLNFGTAQGPRSMVGMGVRFTAFEEDGEERLVRRLRPNSQLH